MTLDDDQEEDEENSTTGHTERKLRELNTTSLRPLDIRKGEIDATMKAEHLKASLNGQAREIV